MDWFGGAGTCTWATGDSNGKSSQKCIDAMAGTSSLKPTPKGYRCDHWTVQYNTQDCCFYEDDEASVADNRAACAKRCEPFSDVTHLYFHSTEHICLCKTAGPTADSVDWSYAPKNTCQANVTGVSSGLPR